ncbi:hypothetical protein [Actinoplanes flavus]|uniref:Minor tail protein n=1 Tax=Actinoplanes flavus TaxID=2820290 RepID=A0ABS3UWZ4_9ACTN|nr:hypothetical protein [Actinoplanes flavus]MBO3743103.1 hypothetical protein [Actinoplanes flavus]
MAVVRVFEQDDYLPEYSLLVLRDTSVEWSDEDPDLPRHRDRGDEPAGTFAGAGGGWLAGQAPGDGVHRVVLELHDTAPPQDHADWADAMETPYRSSSGGLSLTTLTGGVGPVDFEIGHEEWFRVRVRRRAAPGAGERRYDWLISFWPDRNVEPPVWLARGTSAIGPRNDGWHAMLPYDVMSVAYVVINAAEAHGGPVTADQVQAGYVVPHLFAPGWMDDPLPAGAKIDAYAAQLGVPPVRRKRDVLTFMAAAGILVREDGDRYRAGRFEPIDTVLSLPPAKVDFVHRMDATGRWQRAGEDLASVWRWSRAQPLETTGAELSARLLIGEPDLADVVTHLGSSIHLILR